MYSVLDAPRPAPSPREASARQWLTVEERSPPSLTLNDTLYTAVEAFTADTGLRLIPVIDAALRPIGALFESDIRRLLLNPFGHALLRNPTYGHGIDRFLRDCPVAEAGADARGLIDVYRAAGGTEGMILTVDGRLFAVLGNSRLVHLAAEVELAAGRSRVARAQRIEAASERFEAQTSALAATMDELSTMLKHNAVSTTDRATLLSGRAVAVATAAEQTGHNMNEVATRGGDLVSAMGVIGSHTSDVRTAAADAASLMTTGSARARELLRAAQSIDSVIALIGEIARQVNLLALNATIEAARAGEAGSGFTVVANEVKQLSNQTGTAAARITAHVREISQGIDEVAAGHEHVEATIHAMAGLASKVQAAVVGQEAATRLIARNVDEAGDAMIAIQHDIEAIGDTSRAASHSANQMAELAARLQGGASALTGQVGTFLAEIRTA